MATTSEEISKNQATDGIREDMVQTAVRFLQNPNVVNTPLAQKQKFLQRKGLTDPEIQLACERSGAYTAHNQNNIPLPPSSLTVAPYGYGYRQVQITWFDRLRELVHNVAIFSIVAYVIHKFYQNYVAPFLFGKKKKSVEDSIKDLDINMKESVKNLQENLECVKIEVDKINQSSDLNTSRQLSDIKSDIATVKGLLLSRKQFPVVPPSIPAWQMASVDPGDHDQDVEDRKNEDLMEVGSGSGSGSSEPEHCTKTSESSLEIM
ncbi:peroxisomal membrane protein PEX14 isoform X2 [Aethina tumida]|uniref:peroxisomal membrane protein PEX14 isoform X2 n=1 Tax=Aethina tumida TaxID=116153 RepID=UPI00214922C3|nr:peroxisomal membrane protein PEX14 isoform X2 [Aethina tumida]